MKITQLPLLLVQFLLPQKFQPGSPDSGIQRFSTNQSQTVNSKSTNLNQGREEITRFRNIGIGFAATMHGLNLKVFHRKNGIASPIARGLPFQVEVQRNGTFSLCCKAGYLGLAGEDPVIQEFRKLWQMEQSDAWNLTLINLENQNRLQNVRLEMANPLNHDEAVALLASQGRIAVKVSTSQTRLSFPCGNNFPFTGPVIIEKEVNSSYVGSWENTNLMPLRILSFDGLTRLGVPDDGHLYNCDLHWGHNFTTEFDLVTSSSHPENSTKIEFIRLFRDATTKRRWRQRLCLGYSKKDAIQPRDAWTRARVLDFQLYFVFRSAEELQLLLRSHGHPEPEVEDEAEEEVPVKHFLPQNMQVLHGMNFNVLQVLQKQAGWNWKRYEFPSLLRAFAENPESILPLLDPLFLELRNQVTASLTWWNEVYNSLTHDQRVFAADPKRRGEVSGWMIDLAGVMEKSLVNLQIYLYTLHNRKVENAFDLIMTYHEDPDLMSQWLQSFYGALDQQNYERLLTCVQNHGLRNDQL